MQDLWIFGYGSIIWRVDFPYLESKPAYIKNWSRRFWQGSTDHRGVPGKPGRVVTLIPAPAEICWGRAYRIDPAKQNRIMSDLDHREKGGYDRLLLDIYFSETDSTPGVTYHATSANPNYLGEASATSIAKQVRHSSGPSGTNSEYVHRLHEALVKINALDKHVSDIVAALNRLSAD